MLVAKLSISVKMVVLRISINNLKVSIRVLEFGIKCLKFNVSVLKIDAGDLRERAKALGKVPAMGERLVRVRRFRTNRFEVPTPFGKFKKLAKLCDFGVPF